MRKKRLVTTKNYKRTDNTRFDNINKIYKKNTHNLNRLDVNMLLQLQRHVSNIKVLQKIKIKESLNSGFWNNVEKMRLARKLIICGKQL